jgi:hypothetical protein
MKKQELPQKNMSHDAIETISTHLKSLTSVTALGWRFTPGRVINRDTKSIKSIAGGSGESEVELALTPQQANRIESRTVVSTEEVIDNGRNGRRDLDIEAAEIGMSSFGEGLWATLPSNQPGEVRVKTTVTVTRDEENRIHERWEARPSYKAALEQARKLSQSEATK